MADVIRNTKYHKVVIQRGIVDIIRMTWQPRPNIKKLTKDTYVKIERKYENGELKEYLGEVLEMSKSGERNERSLKKIYRDLRQLIATNFSGEDNEIFLTLTYDYQNTDAKVAHRDFEVFWKRLKRYWKEYELGYISILEPQESGRWHYHVLIKSFNEYLPKKIDYKKIYELWGHGRIHIERLNNIDHIGAYFIAYFKSVPLNEEEAINYDRQNDIRTDKEGKKYIKGARIKWYNDYTHIYRASKNIKKPTEVINPNNTLGEGFEHNTRHEAILEITDEKGITNRILQRQREFRKEQEEDGEDTNRPRNIHEDREITGISVRDRGDRVDRGDGESAPRDSEQIHGESG